VIISLSSRSEPEARLDCHDGRAGRIGHWRGRRDRPGDRRAAGGRRVPGRGRDLRAAEAEKAAGAIADAAGGGRRRALGLELDVTDGASVAAAVEATSRSRGPIDVLVNNAGWDELRPFVDTDEEFWRRVVEVNYMGCLRMTRAVLPRMLERGWGGSSASPPTRPGSAHRARRSTPGRRRELWRS
jgi:NAD(P)-dependent dehydrogenase (short-subunit alcohol dehydrogenase family)